MWSSHRYTLTLVVTPYSMCVAAVYKFFFRKSLKHIWLGSKIAWAALEMLFESVGSVLEIRPPAVAHTVSRKFSIPPESLRFFSLKERSSFYDLSSTDLLPLRGMISTKPPVFASRTCNSIGDARTQTLLSTSFLGNTGRLHANPAAFYTNLPSNRRGFAKVFEQL